MRTAAVAVAFALAIAGMLTSCGGDSGDSSKKVGRQAAAGLAAQSAQAAQQPAGQQGTRRSVVYTGTLRVRAGSARRAASDARRVASGAGGYLANENDNSLDKDHQVGVTLRVPSNRFDQVLGQLSALGKVQERSVDSEDVTDRVVDLQGRLDNAKVSADRLRQLLANAVNITEVVGLEDRLTKRDADIESLTGRLEVIKDQAALATINATFTERDEPGVAKNLPSFVRSLRNGAVTVANVGLVLLSVLGFLLPFLPFVILAWLVFRWWRRRHRSTPARPPTSPLWGYPPPLAGPGPRPAPGRPDAPPMATSGGSVVGSAETVSEPPGSTEV